MPLRPLHPCAQPGCPALVRDQARCVEHTKAQKRDLDQRKRPEDRRFYASAAWRKARAFRLMYDRYQCQCSPECRETATVVHHVIPRRERPDLAFKQSNLQSMYKPHHDAETAREVWHR